VGGFGKNNLPTNNYGINMHESFGQHEGYRVDEEEKGIRFKE
jgi:hypothetical protein